MKNKRNIFILIATIFVVWAVFGLVTHFYESKKAAEESPSVEADKSRLIRDDSWSQGPSVAKVTVVEFLDPECESCAAMYPIVKDVLAGFGGKVRLVTRYMPFHGNSVYAATALEAAGRQNKYWEALALLFEKQAEWASHHAPRPDLIPNYMKSLGIDMKQFEVDLKDPKFKEKIDRDKADGMALGVRATPTFFINGQVLSELGYDAFKNRIDEELGK